MRKGLTTLFTLLPIIFVGTSIHAEEKIDTEITAFTSVAPSAKITIQNENYNSIKDRYIIAKRIFVEESKIVDEIMALAESGEPVAQHQLGEIYQNGKGVTKSDIVALMWYIVSEENGHKSASKSKEFTEQYMAFDQIRQAYKMAEKWIED